jgi:Fe-S-cluster containining protein
MLDEILDAYQRHCDVVDAEFKRVSRIYADRMQCGRGCSMCCSQMFSISLIEASYISRAVKALPDNDRDRLRTAAIGYREAAARMRAGDGETSEVQESVTPMTGLRLPCPALVNDACSIYDSRPIICRKWGIPIFNPKKPLELQACELNFRPGDEVEMDGLLEPQIALLEQWVELKGLAGQTLTLPARTATVAEAVLYDFEDLLGGNGDGLREIK